MKLIDKDAAVAEIERTQKVLNLDDLGGRSVMAWCEGFKRFLDTLEVKEVDLEKEIEEQCKKVNQLAVGKELRNICRHFFELGMTAQKEQFEKNRQKHCDSITNEQAELESGFIDQHLNKHQRMPTFLDAIEYGMQLQKEQMMKYAVDGQLEDSDDYLRIKCLSTSCKPEDNGKLVKVIVINEK